MENLSIINFCEVLSIDDDEGGDRIKVRIDPYDTNKTIPELPYCFPLMPKHFYIKPKVGECVIIIMSRVNSGQRFYLGPVISQNYFLKYDPFKYSSRSLIENVNYVSPLKDPSMNPENKGNILEDTDVSIRGRENSDIILKNNEIRLRCGSKKLPKGKPIDTLLFNREDLSYIQMKYKKMTDNKGKDFSSVINMVADKINLLSHDSKTPFNLNDEKELINDDELLKILDNAHPMVYGDNLVEFLKKLIIIIRTHTHSFPMSPPIFTEPQTKVLDTNLDNFLSQSIKLN